MNKKSTLLVTAVVVAIAALGIWLVLRPTQTPVEDVHSVANWLPSDTLLLLYVPDPAASAARFDKTALAAIGREPSVQAFLERPLGNVPAEFSASWKQHIDKIAPLRPRQLFVCISQPAKGEIDFTLGFRYTGDRERLEQLLEPLKKGLLANSEAPVSTSATHEGVAYETVAADGQELSGAHIAGWYFLTNGSKAMQRLIPARLKGLEASLSSNNGFAKLTGELSPVVETLAYANIAKIIEGLEAWPEFTAEPETMKQAGQFSALAAATIFDGADIRDEVRALRSPNSEVPAGIQLQTRALVGSEPLIYNAWSIKLPSGAEIEENAGEMSAPLAALSSVIDPKVWDVLRSGLGNEAGLIVDWKENQTQPIFAIAVPIVDRDKTLEAVRQVTAKPMMGQAWSRLEDPNGEVYSVTTAAGLMTISPVIFVSQDFLILGTDRDAVTALVANAADGGGNKTANAEKSPASLAFAREVSVAASGCLGFGWCDTALLFNRVYGLIGPFAPLAGVFMPGMNEYVDLTKLPDRAAVSAHLSPMHYLHRMDGDMMKVDSSGPIPFTQALGIGGAGFLGFSTFQMLQSMGGGMPPGMSIPLPGVDAGDEIILEEVMEEDIEIVPAEEPEDAEPAPAIETPTSDAPDAATSEEETPVAAPAE